MKGSEGLVFDGVSDASRESKLAANDPRGAICFRIFAQGCVVGHLSGYFNKAVYTAAEVACGWAGAVMLKPPVNAEKS